MVSIIFLQHFSKDLPTRSGCWIHECNCFSFSGQNAFRGHPTRGNDCNLGEAVEHLALAICMQVSKSCGDSLCNRNTTKDRCSPGSQFKHSTSMEGKERNTSKLGLGLQILIKYSWSEFVSTCLGASDNFCTCAFFLTTFFLHLFPQTHYQAYNGIKKPFLCWDLTLCTEE